MRRERDSEPLRASLLDRLSDDKPTAKRDASDRVYVSPEEHRAAVVRDLAWLLNTVSLLDDEEERLAPLAAESVLNFGVREMTGRTASTVEPRKLERSLKKAILAFEPRFIASTLKLRVVADEDASAHNAVVFQIEGRIEADPRPLHLALRSELDLETGGVSLAELEERG